MKSQPETLGICCSLFLPLTNAIALSTFSFGYSFNKLVKVLLTGTPALSNNGINFSPFLLTIQSTWATFVQGKRTLFLSCLLEQGFSYYLVLLLKIETFVGQGLQDLDAFALDVCILTYVLLGSFGFNLFLTIRSI